VNIIYIGTLNTCHYADAMAALEAGKNVLVEKPACLNVAEWDNLVSIAKQRGLFLMEGEQLDPDASSTEPTIRRLDPLPSARVRTTRSTVHQAGHRRCEMRPSQLLHGVLQQFVTVTPCR
jgi:hypothetical protein